MKCVAGANMTTLPSTSDYTQSQLATLLANAVSSTDLTTILKNHPKGGIVETDNGGPYTSPIQQVADSNGHNPNMLLLFYNEEIVDTSSFVHLHTVIQEVASPSSVTQLTLFGDSDLHVYLQPTAVGYIILDNMNNNTLIVSGSNANVELNVLTSDSAIYGTNQTIVAREGHNAIDIGGGTSGLLLNLGGGNNVVNIYGGIEAIQGIGSSDTIHFDQPITAATIAKTIDAAGRHITTVSFSPTEVVTLVGWHDAATFSGDGSIHYI
jgi:hypothetical protein